MVAVKIRSWYFIQRTQAGEGRDHSGKRNVKMECETEEDKRCPASVLFCDIAE